MRPRCTKGKGFWIGSGPKWNRLADQQHSGQMTFTQVKSMICKDSRPSPGPTAVLVCQNSQLRDGRTNQKSTLNEAFPKADSKASSQSEWE
jgi:hypothetical protein